MSDGAGEKKRKKVKKDKKEHRQKKTKRTLIDDESAPSLGLKLTFKFGGKSIKSVVPPVVPPTLAAEDTPRKSESDEEWLPVPVEALEDGPLEESGNASAMPQAMPAEAEAQHEREAAESPLQAAERAAPKIKFAPMLDPREITENEEHKQKCKLVCESQDEKQAQVQKLRKDPAAAGKATVPAPAKVQEAKPSQIQHLTNANGVYVNLPAGVVFPVAPTPRRQYPPAPPKCTVDGCPERKRYADSTSGRPLCSLKCFKLLRASTSAVTAAAAATTA